ncbi:MAG: hypothetical protein MR681_02920 [Prevotella sp.]|nr:hypothetical protein [Prevotella sp.]
MENGALKSLRSVVGKMSFNDACNRKGQSVAMHIAIPCNARIHPTPTHPSSIGVQTNIHGKTVFDDFSQHTGNQMISKLFVF